MPKTKKLLTENKKRHNNKTKRKNASIFNNKYKNNQQIKYKSLNRTKTSTKTNKKRYYITNNIQKGGNYNIIYDCWFTINYDIDTHEKLIKHILKESNIDESEHDLFITMLKDINDLIGILNWKYKHKFIRDNIPENDECNVQIKSRTDNTGIAECKKKSNCIVYESLNMNKIPKCISKEKLKKFEEKTHIYVGKTKNLYVIEKFIYSEDISISENNNNNNNINNKQFIRDNNYKIVILKLTIQINLKNIYLIMFPYGKIFIDVNIIEYFKTELSKYIKSIDISNAMFFLSGHSMGGALAQIAALHLSEIDNIDIRLILTSSVAYYDDRAEQLLFKNVFKNKYISIGLEGLNTLDKKDYQIDNFMLKFLNDDNFFDDCNIDAIKKFEGLLDTFIIKIDFNSQKKEIVIKDLKKLNKELYKSECEKKQTVKTAYMYEEFNSILHNYTNFFKPFILSI